MVAIRIGRVVAAAFRMGGVFLAQLITLHINTNRAKREFKRTLIDMGLPEDAVSELTLRYPSVKDLGMKFDPREVIR